MRLSSFEINETPYELGEVSSHSGYTFHRAGPNTLDTPREVMKVMYMDSEMCRAEPKTKAQVTAWNNWCNGAQIDEGIDTLTNPVLYEA